MDRHSGHPQFARRPVLGVHGYSFHGIQRTSVLGPLDDLAKDGVFSIEVRLFGIGDEELRLVRIRPRIGTRHNAAAVKLERRSDLVGKRLAPDGLSAFSRASGIASLNHERLDVAMPLDVVVRPSSAVTEKVLCCSWGHVAEHFDLPPSKEIAIAKQDER